jgi:DNA-binding beta-propeller fold protein YncE
MTADRLLFKTGSFLPFIAVIGCFVLPGNADSEELRYLYTISGYVRTTEFRDPSCIFFDKAGNELYVADTGNNRIVVFDKDGLYRRELTQNGKLTQPFGLTIMRDGRIYVTETGSSKIKVLGSGGELVSEFNIRNWDEAPAVQPGRIYSRENLVYLIDKSKKRIVICDSECNFRLLFAGRSDEPFREVEDVEVSDDNKIYVSCSAGTGIHVFDSAGNFLIRFGRQGLSDERFTQASGMAIDRHRRLWVTDYLAHSIKVFDLSGKFLFKAGKAGSGTGELLNPVDIAFDDQERAYVLERGNRRVQVFEIR